MPACSQQIRLLHRNGLHVRPCTSIVQTTNRFSSEVTIKVNGRSANAKSIIELLSLEAGYGDLIEIYASGQDAPEVIEQLLQLIRNRFGFDD